VLANKVKFQRNDALAIARAASTVLVAKGKKLQRFNLSEGVSDDELAATILGRSGTLRAPAIRVGSTLLVGFNEGAYGEIFD